MKKNVKKTVACTVMTMSLLWGSSSISLAAPVPALYDSVNGNFPQVELSSNNVNQVEAIMAVDPIMAIEEMDFKTYMEGIKVERQFDWRMMEQYYNKAQSFENKANYDMADRYWSKFENIYNRYREYPSFEDFMQDMQSINSSQALKQMEKIYDQAIESEKNCQFARARNKWSHFYRIYNRAVESNTSNDDKKLVVADAALYKGQIEEVKNINGQTSILVKKHQNDKGYSELIFHINENTRINTNSIADLQKGQTIEIYYSGMVTRSLPGQTTAIAINLVKQPSLQQGAVFQGTIKEIKNNNHISFLINGHHNDNSFVQDVVFHVSDNTKIVNGNIEDIKVGTKVQVKYSGIMAMSIPGQASAEEISILD